MKQKIVLKNFQKILLLTIVACIIEATRRQLLPSVKACLPRVNIVFPKFGKEGNLGGGDAENSYDKQAEQRAKWTTQDWIKKHNYAFEEHLVTTKDGYQLQIQRLPKLKKRPIILVHGLLTSSLSWVLMGPAKSLAFQLYDKHFDVWLANLRGSAYGRNHLQLNVSNVNFWNFSFHEQGIYDLPAIIDYVRSKSPFHQVMLITHSQAFNAFLVMCSQLPEYNERVLFMQALAPLTRLKGNVKFKTEDATMVMKFLKKKQKSLKHEVLPAGELSAKCLKRNSDERRVCLEIFDTFSGVGQHSRALDPLIFGALLQGGSIREITHLYQIWQSGDFVSYDYGHLDNLGFYNSVNPLVYNLTKISVPIILHFGETDAIATPNGVHSIYSRLIQTETIYGVYRVAASKFNHFDFLLSNDIKKLINNKLIEIIEKYFAGQLTYVIE